MYILKVSDYYFFDWFCLYWLLVLGEFNILYIFMFNSVIIVLFIFIFFEILNFI